MSERKNEEQSAWKPISREGVEKLFEFQDQLLEKRGGVPFENSRELLYEAREERDRELMGEDQAFDKCFDAITAKQPLRPLTPEMVAKVMEVHQKILKATSGRVFEDSVEEIRQMREERMNELVRNHNEHQES